MHEGVVGLGACSPCAILFVLLLKQFVLLLKQTGQWVISRYTAEQKVFAARWLRCVP